MREILFRGKRKTDGEWCEGNLFIDEKNDKHEILLGYTNYRIAWEVIPETVGQYTGLTDKNGKRIFEGDIVNWTIRWEHEINGIIESKGIDQVVYKDNCFELKDKDPFLALHGEEGFALEVIGNIHDNPELLRSEQE